ANSRNDDRLRAKNSGDIPVSANSAAIHGRKIARRNVAYHRAHYQRLGAMRIDISFLPALAAAFLLTFARVGSMVMLLPGIGEQSMPSRVRLGIALTLSAILLPAHQKA